MSPSHLSTDMAWVFKSEHLYLGDGLCTLPKVTFYILLYTV